MQRARGLTLIEVMIAVAIVAILASIAIPSYTDYLKRGKMAEGPAAVAAMRVKMEQFFQDNRSYNPKALAAPACPIAVQAAKHFTITCPTLTATTYVLRASGIDDLAGLQYEVNERNARSTTVVASSVIEQAGYTGNASCWVTRKGGTC
jgi:type IV pilus assembly protein PilE